MCKAQIILITGFLGSGKTTLLKQIINKYSAIKKIAIVQNEYSGAGIDSFELKSFGGNFKILEINNGSVFCICQFSNFINKLTELYNLYRPEIVFIEATGLADPLAIGEMFNNNNFYYLAGVIAMVDLPNFKKALGMLTSVQNQIRVADLVMLNKCDLAETRTEIEEILHEVHKLNPLAQIAETRFAEYDISGILKLPEKRRLHGELSVWNEKIMSEVIRSANSYTYEEAKVYVNRFGPDFIRLKGFIKSCDSDGYIVQGVFGKAEICKSEFKVNNTELIKICLNT